MIKILVIEDDEQLVLLLKAFLTQAGYQVAAASNGQQGINQFKAAPADLVLTDLFMPEKEGLETIMELRHMQPNLKIIAMSGGSRLTAKSMLPTAQKLGATRTIAKPFNRQEILEAVSATLSGTP
jgi:DNA-binding response OmpR family regulator